ncbi:MAG TPA: hypothetical protein VLC51_01650, partial [Nitrospira sp.]|nr:hypothetical protein [Nitrospira sp.]
LVFPIGLRYLNRGTGLFSLLIPSGRTSDPDHRAPPPSAAVGFVVNGVSHSVVRRGLPERRTESVYIT